MAVTLPYDLTVKMTSFDNLKSNKERERRERGKTRKRRKRRRRKEEKRGAETGAEKIKCGKGGGETVTKLRRGGEKRGTERSG